MAASGDFDANLLDQFRYLPELNKARVTVYYLASLYLQLGDKSAAREVLSSVSSASSAMKKFYHCLLYTSPSPRDRG